MIDFLRAHALGLLWGLEDFAVLHHLYHLAVAACHAAVSLGAYGPCLQ